MTSKAEERRRRGIVQSSRAQADAEDRARRPLDKTTLRSLLPHLEEQLLVRLDSGDLATRCDHSLRLTNACLAERGAWSDGLPEWLAEYGGHCDCEVMFNSCNSTRRPVSQTRHRDQTRRATTWLRTAAKLIPMWRHGDVLIDSVERIPSDATERPGTVLVEGDTTGHKHEIEDPSAVKIFERDGLLFMQILTPSARLVHPEHRAIVLHKGCYRVWRQRVYLGEERSGFVLD